MTNIPTSDEVHCKPNPELYEIFLPAEISDMMAGLETKHELPLKFTYMGEGAERWNTAIEGLPKEKQVRLLPPVEQILPYFSQYLSASNSVEVIDLGPGNGLQAQGVLAYLLQKKQLARYVGVDISSRMLDIAADNILRWSNGAVQMEKYRRDFIREPLSDIINASPAKDSLIRLILMLGGTLDNDPSPVAAMRQIRQNLRPSDLLLYDVLNPLEGQPSGIQPHALSPRHTFLLDLLGLPADLYTAERVYDANSHIRTEQITPKVDLKLAYTLDEEAHILLPAERPITIWRYHAQTAAEATENLTASGFDVINMAYADSKRQVLLLAQAS